MSIHITNKGNRIRATGADANALFAALTAQCEQPAPKQLSETEVVASLVAQLQACLDGSVQAQGVQQALRDGRGLLARWHREGRDVAAGHGLDKAGQAE